MNIILTGLRGSGKTRVGEIIAKELGWNFVDIDDKIEKKEKQTIPKIVKLHGWKHFRNIESKVTEGLSILDKTVISTGGGTIIDKENEKILKKNGKVIYLYVKPEICAKRIFNSKNRPPLTDKENIEEEINQLYKERNYRYCKSANLIFKRTNNKKTDAKKIISILFEE